jgi:hypothetical protein
MSYPASAAHLKQLFIDHDYSGRIKRQSLHSATVTVATLSNSSSIQIAFLGYKRGATDYRVELVKNGAIIPLSHMNIVVDLVNKAAHQGMDVDGLRAALEEHAVKGNLDFNKLASTLPYQQNAPSQELLQRAHTPRGNESDLTLEELFTAIHWIALQEDINYPIANGKAGRKMSYYRYAEALHGVKHGTPTIEEMVSRTQFKGYPPALLHGQGVNYDFTHHIK